MAEKDLHRKLRDWAYQTYGQIEIQPDGTVTGLLKIVKQTMLAQYGEAGAPDWCVLVRHKPVGYAFFIELKNPDGSGECTDKQLLYHAWLRAMGFKVYVVDRFQLGKDVITMELQRLKGVAKVPKRMPLGFP
jgi:hypothetical protein